MTNDREHFKRVQNFFEKYCASYNIIPLKPKRPIEKLFKKDYFFCEKEFALFFPLRQRKTDPKEQSIRVHKEFLTKIVQVKSLNPKDLSRRFKQSFQKKAVLSVTNDFGLLFLVLSSMTNVRKIIIRLRKVY